MPAVRSLAAAPSASLASERAGEATRRRLLDAAGACFAARGFRGATMREIAARAGVNLAAANYHFGSKQALYLEVVREHFEALERRLVEAGAGAASDEELDGLSRAALEALLAARLRTLLRSLLVDDPLHAALTQRELLDPSDALQSIVRRWVVPMREAIERIVARLAPELSPEQRARCCFSAAGQVFFYLTHRPALLLMMGRRRYPRGFVDEVAAHVTEFTLGGIERLRAQRRRGSAR